MEANTVLPQSVLHPDSLSAQECPISYLSALCAHLGAPTLHSRQSGLPISSLPSTPPLVLPTVPGLVPLSGISDGSSEHQDCSGLLSIQDLLFPTDFRIIGFGSMKNVIVILIEVDLNL